MMNTINKRILFLVSAIGLFTSPAVFANVNPSLANLKVYGVAVSQSADCSNAKVVGYNSAGQILDFLANPPLAAGAIDPGTYNCVVLYMENSLEFQPVSTTGSCTGATTYKRTICSASGCLYTDASPDANNILVFGTDKTPDAANSADVTHPNKVLLFLSTSSIGTGMNAFQKPDSSHWSYGLPLTSPLVVAASGGTGTFVVNFNGKINGTMGTCDLDPPVFGFR
jgi:hypothetical protein